MHPAIVAQVVGAAGRALREGRVEFAVEQADRIGLQAPLAVLAEFAFVRLAEFVHRLAKFWTADRISDRVDLESEAQPEFARQLLDHDQQLGVARGVGASEHFDPELIELPVAALLRALAPEHRARVIEALLGVAAIESGLDIRADHAGSAFRTKREGGLGLVAIGEQVHLLFDDIGGLAGRALVEPGALDQRNSNLTEAVTLDHRLPAFLDQRERLGAGADEILKAPESCQLLQSSRSNKKGRPKAALL